MDDLRAATPLDLLNSLGIVGPNIIHAEQGMYPDGKHSEDDTWDGPGWCVCRRPWPCEAKQLGDLLAATPEPTLEPTLDAERLRVLWPAGANWSSGKREVIIELGPIVDGRCSSCGASPSRETGSCRCLPTIAARLHERTEP